MNLLTELVSLFERFILVSKHNLFESSIGKILEVNPEINVQYRIGGAADLEKLNPLEHDFDSEAKCYGIKRLLAGDLLVLGEYDGCIVFYCFVCVGGIELGYDRFISSASDIAFIYKVFVVKQMRGKRVYPGLFTFLKPCLTKRGVRRIMTQINDANTASLNAIRRCGFNCLGVFHRVRFPGQHCYLNERAVRKYIGNNN